MGDEGAETGLARRVRPFSRRTETLFRLALTVLLLYLFLVGVKALEEGIGALGSEFVDGVFRTVANPLAGLAAGILGTVLVQSSSVSTATIVGMVGAGVLSVEAAVPMVMGANIGTTVTNTLASLGHIRQGAYFERALAAAMVHDFFNILAVMALLPLELAFGVVSRLARWAEGLVDGLLPAIGGDSPVRAAVKAPVDLMESGVEMVGWGGALAPLLLGMGLTLIFLGLWSITRQMKIVMSGRIENAINSILSKGAGLSAIVIGAAMTVAVQSSSITTSLLVPLVAAGVLTLANAFPVTLGANIGTTITALLASVAAESPEALVIALAHVSFNLLGTAIVYPWPPVRRVPILLAMRAGRLASAKKRWLAVYVIGIFVILPLLILVLS